MDTNLIYCGDSKDILLRFPDKSVDLIYADPPFFSNKAHEIIWKNGAETKVYEDRWKGGINVFIEWMEPRIAQCHRVLKDKGSMYLHCDWHANAHLRILMDRIFGDTNFQNEIVWYYKGAGVSPKRWARRHDAILFYTKGKEWYFNPDPVRDEYAESTKERFSHYIGNVRNGHDFGEQSLNPKGKHPDDVWQIKIVAPSARARLGYPTQKPEALLERIIKASSKKNAIILDPFVGGGTTPAVAHQLNRRWIGIDVSPTACRRTKERLEKIGVKNLRIIGAPKTIKELQKLSDWAFQNWVVERISGTPSPKKSDDKGVDGYTFMTREPIQVKQSEGVGRNVVDNFQTAVRRKQKTTGFIFAFSFAKGAYEEASRAKQEDGINIRLIRIDEMDKEFPIA